MILCKDRADLTASAPPGFGVIVGFEKARYRENPPRFQAKLFPVGLRKRVKAKDWRTAP
jgi:hypothetical protein